MVVHHEWVMWSSNSSFPGSGGKNKKCFKPPRHYIINPNDALIQVKFRKITIHLLHQVWFTPKWQCNLISPTVHGRNPANQLRLVVYPILYRVLRIPGGQPDFWTINSMIPLCTHKLETFTHSQRVREFIQARWAPGRVIYEVISLINGLN